VVKVHIKRGSHLPFEDPTGAEGDMPAVEENEEGVDCPNHLLLHFLLCAGAALYFFIQGLRTKTNPLMDF
jgi:hypothetical protein